MTQILLLNVATAQQLAASTAGDGDHLDRLEPRQITAGPYAGSYALGTHVLDDPDYEALWPTLAALPVVEIDPVVAWPDSNA